MGEKKLAEGVGFEPTLGLLLGLISSQVPSTTQPPFQSADFIRETPVYQFRNLSFLYCDSVLSHERHSIRKDRVTLAENTGRESRSPRSIRGLLCANPGTRQADLEIS